MFANILGTVVVVRQMSERDRLERKNYMGTWRWVSEVMAKMISRFPITGMRDIERKIQKRKDYNSGSHENSRRRNYNTCE
jgi:hypothetical protein